MGAVAMMGYVVLVVALAAWVCLVGWVLWRVWRLERQMAHLREVLSVIDPVLAQRVRQEGSTRVVIGDRWEEGMLSEEP